MLKKYSGAKIVVISSLKKNGIDNLVSVFKEILNEKIKSY